LAKRKDKLTGVISPEEGVPYKSKLVLILGVPRSGTSWIGKIFDSHPAVVYRHEPDDVIGQKELPLVCPIEDIPRYTDAARRFVARLTNVRQIKSVGTWPVFAKQFQPFPAPFIRRALVVGVRAAQAVSPTADWLKQLAIPDLINHDSSRISYVIKSINMLGDAALLATALPESRVIVVFRHPCGHIASIKRGQSNRIMSQGPSRPTVLATSRARELGFTKERYDELPILDCHAWAWAFLHEKLFKETTNLPNVRLLRYEDLCCDPETQARALLEFAQLPWAAETSKFIDRSTRASGTARYFSVYRDPMDAATKWRRELAPDEIVRFMGIVEKVIPGVFSA
jgi:Sulfotransferase family